MLWSDYDATAVSQPQIYASGNDRLVEHRDSELEKSWINSPVSDQYRIAGVECGRGTGHMAAEQLSQVVRHLRGLLANPELVETPDADLLQRYIHERNEMAFETLVRRHGPMVLGVCRRLLHNPHDAEDAFQVTFLVLVRKAKALRSPDSIGNWLYGVAYRTAMQARKASAKRRAKEAMVVPHQPSQDQRADLQSLLDQELKRLPHKHREVVVLCDLEGKTRKEAALDLGCAEGTVASRLARARTVLAKRLTRHGLPLSAGTLALLFSEDAVSASPPASLISATTKAAGIYAVGQTATAGVISTNVAALADGVLRTMFFTKLKIAAAIIAGVFVAGVGVSSVIYETQGAEQGKAVIQGGLKLKDDAVKGDAASNKGLLASDDLRGKWAGQKDEIKVELTFYGRQARWQAQWRVDYKKTRKPEDPRQSPIQVNKEADLKCTPDPEQPGRLNLYLPAYLGDKKEIKESSWNGKKPVGEVRKLDENSIQLRIIPTGYEDAATLTFDFPAAEGMILHRVVEQDKKVGQKPAAPAGEEKRIQPGDRLQIQVTGTPPDRPINGIFRVEPRGTIALGPGYGRVQVVGGTLDETEHRIIDRLLTLIKNPEVSVTCYDPVPDGRVEALEERIQQLEDTVRKLQASLEALPKQKQE